MAIQYGYNAPVAQTPYGYQQAPLAYYTPAPAVQMAPPPMAGRNNYMIQVDGEMAAKAWQMPPEMKPGDVIPLWDADGVHVYFKSLDGYGRLNPTRKARIVFEEETPALPENTSGAMPPQENPNYVSKADFESFRNEIRQMMSGNRQNGRNNGPQGNPQRGGSENA